MNFHRVWTVAVLAVAASGCGDSGTAPAPAPELPNVAGTYAGEIRVDVLVGQGRIVVEQDGERVSATGTFTRPARTFELAEVAGLVSASGAVQLEAGSTWHPVGLHFDPECEFETMQSATLAFAGDLAMISESWTSACHAIELSGTLTRLP